MPIPPPIPANANVTTPTSTQMTLQSPSSVSQASFRKMVGEVAQWNPDAPIPMIMSWLNNAYRAIIDERMWYGLFVRGQCQVPQMYSAGNVTVTTGSATVTGSGTAFNNTMIGQQFRIGFTQGWMTIAAVPNPQELTLAMPWGDIPYTNIAFQIAQPWVTLGPNIKFVKEMVNQKQGYRLYTNMPQKVLNIADTWRSSVGWSFLISPLPTTQDGMPQFELYPTPIFNQVFPFLAYIQPPDMVGDNDTPAPFIRTDILVMMAIADAVTFGGPKNNKYYDPQTAQTKRTMAKYEVEKLKNVDDCLNPTDLQWDMGSWPFSQQGSLWMQNHAGLLDESY